MDELPAFLDFLSLPVRVINLVREQVELIPGVVFPALLAQGLGILLFLAVSWYFITKIKKHEGLFRFFSVVVVFAAVFAALSIVLTIGGNYTADRSRDIVGTIKLEPDNTPIQNARVSLLDYGSKEMNYSGNTDSEGVFAIHYDSAEYRFDPPTAIRVSQPGCENVDKPLRPRQLNVGGVAPEFSIRCKVP